VFNSHVCSDFGMSKQSLETLSTDQPEKLVFAHGDLTAVVDSSKANLRRYELPVMPEVVKLGKIRDILRGETFEVLNPRKRQMAWGGCPRLSVESEPADNLRSPKDLLSQFGDSPGESSRSVSQFSAQGYG
jgi:hypothetical protein